ncbi:unnamed protein product [Adineta steineri]|uniref:Uncharacterized protein n=1 Tax=Adineta steineri TaxID=433720 RepID=A0A813Q7I4_9BILA|nr:unnamed protein product [Adineta steineri]CAF4014404.1 unnamed protein product [Adineta steineri]
MSDKEHASGLVVRTQHDLYNALLQFGFESDWAQTYTWKLGQAFADQLVEHTVQECINDRLLPSINSATLEMWLGTAGNRWNPFETNTGRQYWMRFVPRKRSTDWEVEEYEWIWGNEVVTPNQLIFLSFLQIVHFGNELVTRYPGGVTL